MWLSGGLWPKAGMGFQNDARSMLGVAGDHQNLKVAALGTIVVLLGLFTIEQLPRPVFDVCFAHSFTAIEDWYYCNGGYNLLSGWLLAFILLTFGPTRRLYYFCVAAVLVVFGCLEPIRAGLSLIESLHHWITSSFFLGSIAGVGSSLPVLYLRRRAASVSTDA